LRTPRSRTRRTTFFAAKARALLDEFLAELPEQDRTIAHLRLDPAYECTPRQIARELNLPWQTVRDSTRRTSVNLSRFQALLIRPSALCQRRRPDVLEWQRTGIVPLPLRIHLSHCASCRAQSQTARTAVRHALLPLLPATALPLARAGAFSRLWHAAGARPVTQRVDDAMSRWRKIAPVGGGGGAAIAAKLATAGAIATVGGVTAALHAITTHPPAHPHHTAHSAVHHLAIHPLLLTPSSITAASAVSTTATRPVVGPATHTTTTTSTTTSTRAAVPPPPNANPLPASNDRSGNGQVRTDLASTRSSAGSSNSGDTSSSTAYAPAPNQTNVNSSTSSSHANGAANSSGPAAPGGPPAP
jgi:hypothetical protein